MAVWDVPVRIVHWAIVGLIAFSWYSAENHMMDWHRYSGFAILGLLIFRILWGFIGSSTARFSAFVRGPAEIRRYAGTLRKRAPGAGVGHNPVGALSVLALLLVIMVQVGTGLFAVDVDGIESGPLSERVSFDQGRLLAEVHEISFTVLQVLVVLHVFAILFYLLYKRDNLVGPMIVGGRKTGDVARGMTRAPRRNFVIAATVAAVTGWFISQGLHF
ncbi:Ni/Fe-hydrogenase 1 b-type cytochrome subunit [Sphingomonas solaris]|uniref:Ni/Fe-hydrogenase 1 b-type cytochrome subunit n=1 Tax=Alterirhizorhabdus solaris TaxID=2529389 RepID=A0A558R8Z8_9SPHN|nr:Ni/Fe-hydrogenase 1 b-type cytochrome subunit [Sphingomonas solaris]